MQRGGRVAPNARRSFLCGALDAALLRWTVVAAGGASAAQAAQARSPTAQFSLPEAARAVTWERFAVPPYPASIMAAAPYAGTKHTRWARRTVDGCWYVLGGDYTHGSLGVSSSGSNHLWKVTPGRPFAFKQLNAYATSAAIPVRVDEAPWMYDSRRDRFLLYPQPRFVASPQAPNGVIGHLMFYHPANNRWEDLGRGKYTATSAGFDVANNPQFDPNGHQYPIGINNNPKWGHYDERTDKYYIPVGDSQLMVLDAETLAMEWPFMGIGNAPPWTHYDQAFYTACLCFDAKRRRLVTIKSANNGDAANDPNAYRLLCIDIDTRKAYFLETDGPPFDPARPLMLDFEALVHDEASDLYLCYGGGEMLRGDAEPEGTSDLRAVSADGGRWVKLLPATPVAPPARFGQTMHFDPTLKSLFMLGGIGGSAPSVPEMYFPVIHREALALRAGDVRPAWRRAMEPESWIAVPAANTLASLDPEKNPQLNPAGANKLAPWHGVGGQHMAILAWNSAAYDDSTQTLFIGPAGGHADYGGNERYRIRLGVDRPRWELYGNPSGAIGATGNLEDHREATGVYFDGAPRSVHTYNYAVFAPGVGPVIARLTAPFRYSGDVKKAFAIDPQSGGFRQLADYTSAPGSGGILSVGAACYDSKRHCLWMLHTGNVQLQKLDLASGAVTQHGVEDNLAGGCNWIGYASEQDALLAFARPQSYSADRDVASGFSIFELRSFRQRAVSIVGSFAEGFNGPATSDFAAGIAWDAGRRRLVLWHNASNRAQISTLAPSGDFFQDPWRAGSLTVNRRNVEIPTAPAGNGTFGRFVYSSSLDGAFLLNDVKQPIYFYAFS